jgi:formate/nitrite transporter FocA (FNT family)
MTMSDEKPGEIVETTPEEEEAVKEHKNLAAPLVYEIIRRSGEDELDRPAASLWWSGVAAGLSISTCVFCKGYLHVHLPDEPWRPLVSNFGYCVGFVIVVLGSFQLFTEQTITAILPLLTQRTMNSLYRTARLWLIVLAANLAGTLFAAFLASYFDISGHDQYAAFLEISRGFIEKAPLQVISQGILAGFFVGALVWMLPNARGSEFWVVAMIAYIIGLGDFSHVVAGSTEVFLLMFSGEIAPLHTLTHFILPALLGNIIGGTGLFSLITYGQVRKEMTPG